RINVIDEAEAFGRCSVDHITGQCDLHRAPLADEARQTLCAAPAAHYAEVDLGLRESRRLAGHSDVASHCQLVAAPEAEAVDHRDDGLGKSVDRIKERSFVKGVSLCNRRLPLKFADVRAGDEGLLAGTRYDKHPHA